MEENLNNNQEPKMQNPKQEPSLKTKKKKAKVAVITLCTIGVLLLGLQVYASTNGYGNVFFMIKNLITTGNPAGNEEIFSDKDITLSYKSIELAEGLKIQVNRLEIKDGKTKLYMFVKSQNGDSLPLKYEITTKNNEENESKTITNIKGTKPENTDIFEYEDILTLDYEVKENETILLTIKNTKDKELRTLEINLETREITVKGEKEFEKISQIELRKYLDIFSQLNNGAPKSDALIYMAQSFQNNNESFMSKEDFEQAKKSLTDRGFKNQIIKEFYGNNAEFELKAQKNTNQPDVEVLKGIIAWEFDKENDAYKPLTAGEDYHYGRCIKIEEVKFENEIYTVKYIYLLATGYDEDGEKLEELPQYETTIKLKRNEANLYSKYQIISIEQGKEIQNKVNTKVDEEENKAEGLGNNHDNTYTSDYNIINNSGYELNEDANTNDTSNHYSREELMDTNNWVQYWPDVGMKFKLPKNFEQGQVNEEPGKISVNMSGWIVLPILHYEREEDAKYEGIPVIIELYTEIHNNNVNMWDVLENSQERSVKSTDNKQWSDWYPLKENNVPTSSPNGYLRRSYGRVRGDMVEKVIFDMQTDNGMDTPHYTFIRNVLESVSSTSR